MADIDIRRAHGRSVAEARKIVDSLIDKLAADYDVTHQWNGNMLDFKRSGLTGQIALTDQDIHITARLGFLLKALKGRIEKEVLNTLDRKLA